MADVGLLQFVYDGQLAVSYRASAEPQTLIMKVRFSKDKPNAMNTARSFANKISHGMAGGSEFAPSAGRARRVSGDFDEFTGQLLSKREYEFVFEVAAVSPYFIRYMVESMRARVEWMSIQGSLPLDSSPLSVTEADVRRWIQDPKAYMACWEPPPYEEKTEEILRGASLRIHFVDPISAETVDRPLGLAWAITAASSFIQVSFDHTETHVGVISITPQIKRGKAEVSVKWPNFDAVRWPARAIFLNMLTCFHETVQPIRAVTLKLS